MKRISLHTIVVSYMTIELTVLLATCVFFAVITALLYAIGNLEAVSAPYITHTLATTATLFGATIAFALCRYGITTYYVPLGRLTDRLFRGIIAACYAGIFIALYSHVVALVFILANPNWTLSTSLALLQFDAWLGIYVLVERLVTFFEPWPALYSFVMIGYSSAALLVAATAIIVALYPRKLAKQFALTLGLSICLSAPLWLLSPAIAPAQLAQTNVFAEHARSAELANKSVSINELLERNSDTAWAEHTNTWVSLWETVHEDGRGLTVSSNPSTHIIWGLLSVVFLWPVNRVLGVIAALAFVGNVIGTIFFLQHYFVDLFTGALVFLVSYWVAKLILEWERS